MLALVKTIRFETDDIIRIELNSTDQADLPAFAAGDHIDIQLPHGLTKSYSLMNDPAEKGRYVLGVLKDPASQGGSRWIHDNLRVGMRLEINPPSNNFALQENFKHTLLIAGGIGVTPLISMAHRLKALNASFEMIYATKSQGSTAFQDEVAQFGVPVHWHFDDIHAAPPNLHHLIEQRIKSASLNSDTCQLYACGPEPMLNAFLNACASLGLHHAHIERFKALEVQKSTEAKATYTVCLKRSKKTIEVGPQTTLLQALRLHDIEVATSCEEGVCGACETRVISGLPDHLDSVLSDQEKNKNTVMMICVSGCKSELLELDL